jgi:hypothetical protein
MRAITVNDYLKVAGLLVGCLSFLAFIIVMEWHRSEDISKILGIALLVGFSLLATRPLVIYRPRKIDVATLKITRGPQWSSTIGGTIFVWVEVKSNKGTKRIRLVEDSAANIRKKYN